MIVFRTADGSESKCIAMSSTYRGATETIDSMVSDRVVDILSCDLGKVNQEVPGTNWMESLVNKM